MPPLSLRNRRTWLLLACTPGANVSHSILYAAYFPESPRNSFASLSRLAPSIRSSASSQKNHSLLAWRRLSLRAAAKLSTHGKSKTCAPCRTAISFVASVEPVSTTMISSTRSATEPRQSARFASSFLTIMHRETVGLAIVDHESDESDVDLGRHLQFAERLANGLDGA